MHSIFSDLFGFFVQKYQFFNASRFSCKRMWHTCVDWSNQMVNEKHISLSEKEGCNALLLNNLYIQFNFIPWTFFQWIISNFLHSMSLLLHFQKYPQYISPKNVLELQKSKCTLSVFCLKNHCYISRNTLLHKINKDREDF